jgi:tartrate-resistant acid phosphatase type 5
VIRIFGLSKKECNQDLDEAMRRSTAKWKVAVGHHTMRSVSDHGDTAELLQLLLPVLKVTGSTLLYRKPPATLLIPTFKQLHTNNSYYAITFFTRTYCMYVQANGIDFYINGHDHCLEHISSRDR